MAEYIDKNKTIEFVKQRMISTNHGVDNAIYDIATKHALDWVSVMHTEDVVSVVRCKDCYYYNKEKYICTNTSCIKSFYGCRVDEKHYCSYGERKEDNE